MSDQGAYPILYLVQENFSGGENFGNGGVFYLGEDEDKARTFFPLLDEPDLVRLVFDGAEYHGDLIWNHYLSEWEPYM